MNEEKPDVRIVLTTQDFIDLTAGIIITKSGVKICLSDIGYNKMLEIINKNSSNQ